MCIRDRHGICSCHCLTIFLVITCWFCIKMAKCWGWCRSNYANIFGIRKLESSSIVVSCGFLHDPRFICFDTVPACDRYAHRDKHGHTMMVSTVVETLLMVKMGYVTTPHSAVVIHRLEIDAINLCTKFEVCFHKLRRYERQCKM